MPSTTAATPAAEAGWSRKKCMSAKPAATTSSDRMMPGMFEPSPPSWGACASPAMSWSPTTARMHPAPATVTHSRGSGRRRAHARSRPSGGGPGRRRR